MNEEPCGVGVPVCCDAWGYSGVGNAYVAVGRGPLDGLSESTSTCDLWRLID